MRACYVMFGSVVICAKRPHSNMFTRKMCPFRVKCYGWGPQHVYVRGGRIRGRALHQRNGIRWNPFGTDTRNMFVTATTACPPGFHTAKTRHYIDVVPAALSYHNIYPLSIFHMWLTEDESENVRGDWHEWKCYNQEISYFFTGLATIPLCF